MKCRRCKATAVVALPSHNSAFCADCFLEFFSRQVQKGIESHRLMTPEDRVLVALSGGKDSLTLLVLLAELRKYYPKRFELEALTQLESAQSGTYTWLNDPWPWEGAED